VPSRSGLSFGGDDGLASPLSSLRVRLCGFDMEGFVILLNYDPVDCLCSTGPLFVRTARCPIHKLAPESTVEKSQPQGGQNSGEAKP
jgi:hypothetical protein